MSERRPMTEVSRELLFGRIILSMLGFADLLVSAR